MRPSHLWKHSLGSANYWTTVPCLRPGWAEAGLPLHRRRRRRRRRRRSKTPPPRNGGRLPTENPPVEKRPWLKMTSSGLQARVWALFSLSCQLSVASYQTESKIVTHGGTCSSMGVCYALHTISFVCALYCFVCWWPFTRLKWPLEGILKVGGYQL